MTVPPPLTIDRERRMIASRFVTLALAAVTLLATHSTPAQMSPRAPEKAELADHMAAVHSYLFDPHDLLHGETSKKWLSKQADVIALRLRSGGSWGPKHPQWNDVVTRIAADLAVLAGEVRQSRVERGELRLPHARLAGAFASQLSMAELNELVAYYTSKHGRAIRPVLVRLDRTLLSGAPANIFEPPPPTDVVERRAQLLELATRAQIVADAFRNARQRTDGGTAAGASIVAFFGLVLVSEGKTLDSMLAELPNALLERHRTYCGTDLARRERRVLEVQLSDFRTEISKASIDLIALSEGHRVQWQALVPSD